VVLLFWNLNRRRILPLLAQLVAERDVDFVVLAENVFDQVELLEAINVEGRPQFHVPFGFPVRVQLLSRLPIGAVVALLDDDELSIRRVSPPLGPEFLLAAMHLPSKLYLDAAEQAMLSRRFVDPIERAEQDAGHSRTVVIGDLNMNPFEHGLIGSEGFHAVASREIAARGQRRVLRRDRKFFYNPMWRWLAPVSPKPPGTYFRSSPGPLALYWNIFDQVLIRPALLDRFHDDSLHIITSVAGQSLIKRDGSPDRTVASDHLPILFSLEI
jgi:hypothetical protein